MNRNGSLLDHERTFDNLVQSLSAIGKEFDSDELIVLYSTSLPVDIFGNWAQGQQAFIENMSIAKFKGSVREEAQRLNLAGLGPGLGVETNDPDTVQANYARSNQNHQCIFPPRKAMSFHHAATAGLETTLKRTATNASLKNLMSSRPAI